MDFLEGVRTGTAKHQAPPEGKGVLVYFFLKALTTKAYERNREDHGAHEGFLHGFLRSSAPLFGRWTALGSQAHSGGEESIHFYPLVYHIPPRGLGVA